MRNTSQLPPPPKKQRWRSRFAPFYATPVLGGIPFGVASFVFEACATKLLVATGMACMPGHKYADVPVTQNSGYLNGAMGRVMGKAKNEDNGTAVRVAFKSRH
eukprot:2655571-Ditylum_brightwellii.AAC.1